LKEPTRLIQGSGPARELMTGSVLRVPSDARRRALQFTSAAASLAASGTAAAAAGATSLVKTLVLTVTLGAAGGGVMSLAVSKTYSHFEGARLEATQASTARASVPRAKPELVLAPAAAASTAVTEASEPPPQADAASSPKAEEAANRRAPAANAPAAGIGTRDAAPSARAAVAPAAPALEPSDPPPRSSLVEEQRSIESARAAVARGDTGAALSLLDAYERRYPQKQFGPEALALRVQALAARGERARAGVLAAEFARIYPRHPLLSRVRNSVER
jgi:hypothetical protein